MSWTLLVGVTLILGLSLLASLARRGELTRMRRSLAERDTAERQGAAEATLQIPVIDLTRCLGCATCVAVCPEDGVLDVVHGQAMVVNPARCKGITACERECPVGAVTVTVANLAERTDVPALTDELEAVGSPGLFLAGEVTAHALVRRAIEHGTAVAAEVGRRAEGTPVDDDVFDLCIVGAGPAGIACALEAKRLGLTFLVLEQEPEIGGTVARYPRKKLVLTEPIDLPLHGRLKRRAYSKEELIDLWTGLADDHELPIETGVTFQDLETDADGVYVVCGDRLHVRARQVCMAIGRRGSPRRLGVPGEDLAKVAYALTDAASFQNRRVLVVGGGDSAVETALGLAEQDGNEVTLSYRKEAFLRIASRNETRLREAIAAGRVHVVLQSQVSEIGPEHVVLSVTRSGQTRQTRIANDDVFVMIGGVPPFALLEHAGVSFDPALRPPPPEITEQGSGLVTALGIALALTLAAGAFAWWQFDYYSLPLPERPTHPKHALLRPGLGVGLAFGISALVLIALNLLYLVRRAPGTRLKAGSLETWMTAHVATGVLAFLCALLHGAMQPRDTPGGNAFWALGVLLVTGAIGRYFYAQVPRAANGRELELGETRARLRAITEQWQSDAGAFAASARRTIDALVERRQWSGTFFGRVLGIVGVQLDLRQALQEITQLGHQHGVDDARIADTLTLAKRAHRAALMAAHYEDVRAVLGAWRYLHRWVAVLMVVLVIVHIVYALTYGAFWFERGMP